MTWNTRGPRRRRWPLVLGGIGILMLGLVVASAIFAATHDDHAAPAATSASSLPAPAAAADGLSWGGVSWYALNGALVPVSAEHGPRTNTGEQASGFTHDPPGAVLAAVNIAVRSSGLAGGEDIFGPTIARQTTGDVAAYLTATRATFAEVQGRAVPVPVIIGYRLAAGNTADDVRIDIVGRMTNPANAGQRALMSGTLHVRWLEGDWRLVVPTGAGQQITQIPPGFSPMPGQKLSLAG